ncbi:MULTISPECIES: hypothetical protein [Streptomyces]|uniref:Uncharacterized protein n=1 Tax=Streptomyces venezuelae TaxID=54571 RepID=A0A5P2BI90_STRVZ|nr:MULTISPECIES: hypothetical protein [Streptomyces]NEA04758.1 hypothetical protein [Streptomyces sp. SID10116]MYY82855.1 hypothetical protein [Streptomyces sp. SID335]MYZ13720.1 hypothetical protein [Streptomyces sp. SID337]NDZ84227.1 hypothetical protein [Streptomyces sp. SID10115]NEB42949.1 hypothetical protein [Streptomyces sp. SID339]
MADQQAPSARPTAADPTASDPTTVAPASAEPATAHRTTTVEKGRFTAAHCTCGWRGPARRARSKARTDGTEHEASP